MKTLKELDRYVHQLRLDIGDAAEVATLGARLRLMELKGQLDGLSCMVRFAPWWARPAAVKVGVVFARVIAQAVAMTMHGDRFGYRECAGDCPYRTLPRNGPCVCARRP